MNDKGLYRKLKKTLTDLYGDRLVGVVLYGSEARGEAKPNSDIDLLVLLRGPVDSGRELRPIINALYDIQLETDPFRPISVIAVDAETYQKQEFSLLQRVKQEGIPL